MFLEGICSGPTGPGGAREPKARRREPVGGLNVEGVEAFDSASMDEEFDNGAGAATLGGGSRVVDAREANILDPSGCEWTDVGLFDDVDATVSVVADIKTESKGCEPSAVTAFASETPSACARLIIACVSSTTL